MNHPTISGEEIRCRLRDGSEIALLDVRPESVFATGHPLWAASLPLERLETEAYERLPRRTVPIVVMDDGGGESTAAAVRLAGIGYCDVSLLDGGLAGWTAGGGEVFQDVNVPSKAFGELVDSVCRTPSLPAREVAALFRDGTDVVVVDVRRFDEYTTMSIPGATSVPGGELVHRIATLAPDPATLVVVNCAGRTRSIIGAQSLHNAGTANRVVALRNGTIGWSLAGLELDHGRRARAPEPTGSARSGAAVAARSLAARTGVRFAAPANLASLSAPSRTVYHFDVRDPEEFAAGHPDGFTSWPGGQLVQETDDAAPVRGARLVLAGDGTARAPMTASWLSQMGWEVVVVDDLIEWSRHNGPLRCGPHRPSRPNPPDVPSIDVGALVGLTNPFVVDLAASRVYAGGHIPGARWAMREMFVDLTAGLSPARSVVVTSPDGLSAAFAVADGLDRGRPGDRAVALTGGTAAWAAAGQPIETGRGNLVEAPPDVYRRPYEGTAVEPAAMQAYLDWEYGLVAQLERDGTHRFSVWRSAAPARAAGETAERAR